MQRPRALAITNLPNQTTPHYHRAFDTNSVQVKMLKMTGSSFKEILLQLFNKSVEEEIWLWEISKVIFSRKQRKLATPDLRHTTPSQYPATWKHSSNARLNQEPEPLQSKREIWIRNKKDFGETKAPYDFCAD